MFLVVVPCPKAQTSISYKEDTSDVSEPHEKNSKKTSKKRHFNEIHLSICRILNL